jgi:UDP-N-acetylmuramate dehydrogenase
MSSPIHQGFSLIDSNSLGIPAVCNACFDIQDVAEIEKIISEAVSVGQSWIVLGEGTNVVFSQDVNGIVIRPKFSGIEVIESLENEALVRIGAGVNWHELVCWTLDQGYFGLENLALIPGSCGAAPVQNIGAYGVELNRFVERVDYVDLNNFELISLSNAECGFGYRDSRFKHDLKDCALITHIYLRLSKIPNSCIDYPAIQDYLKQQSLEPSPENIFAAVCTIRRKKLPDIKDIPNAGSFFKNPIISSDHFEQIRTSEPNCPGFEQADGSFKVPAAWLIDQRGWKGKMFDGVGVHQNQALVLINPGNKAGSELLRLAKNIQQDIFQAYRISLEIEPLVI